MIFIYSFDLLEKMLPAQTSEENGAWCALDNMPLLGLKVSDLTHDLKLHRDKTVASSLQSPCFIAYPRSRQDCQILDFSHWVLQFSSAYEVILALILQGNDGILY